MVKFSNFEQPDSQKKLDFQAFEIRKIDPFEYSPCLISGCQKQQKL